MRDVELEEVMSVSASDSPGEVVHCPNCKEDVPKTPYCLNCGYPLYKDGQKGEVEKTAAEPAVPPKSDQEDIEMAVEPEEEAKAPEIVEAPEKVASTPTDPQPSIVVAAESLEVEQQPKAIDPEVIKEEPPAPEAPIIKVVEEAGVATEPTKTDIIQEPEVRAETPNASAPEPTIAVTSMIDEYEEKAASTYVPDALTKDLMESLAKNLSVRLKLISLYREGKVREQTFTDLFQDYSTEGESISHRREELLNKLNAELEDVEKGYIDSTQALELMEIKRVIGDISEGEYAAKAPAYKWDIDTYDFKVAENRNRIAYLENLPSVFRKDELKELRDLASLQYNTVDALQTSKNGLIESIKATLYEAIKILG